MTQLENLKNQIKELEKFYQQNRNPKRDKSGNPGLYCF